MECGCRRVGRGFSSDFSRFSPIFSRRRPRWRGNCLTAESPAGAANRPAGRGVGAGRGPAGGGPRGEKWRFLKWLAERFEKNGSASNNHCTIVVGGLRLTGSRSLALSKASRRPPLCAETPCGLSCQHPRPAGGDAADDWSRVDCGTARADSRPAPDGPATGPPSGPVRDRTRSPHEGAGEPEPGPQPNVLPGRRGLRPFHPGRCRRGGFPQRVLHRLHPLPGRGQPGEPAGVFRVPVAGLPTDGAGGFERQPVRRGDRAERGGLHVDAGDRPTPQGGGAGVGASRIPAGVRDLPPPGWL